jgi:hypothetical protein
LKNPSPVSEFWSYLKLILKKWYIILVVMLDLVAVVIPIFNPSLSMPSSIYLLIIILSFLGAGFDVYRENQNTLQNTIKKYDDVMRSIIKHDSNASEQILKIEELIPNIQIEFFEGSEYSFPLRLHDGKYFTDDLPLRLTNTGNVNLQIIGIGSNLIQSFFVNYPIDIGIDEYFTEEKDIHYPFEIARQNHSLITVKSKLHIQSSFRGNAILFAAKLRETISKSDFTKKVIFTVSAINPSDSSIITFHDSFEFSMKPFFDILFKFWEETGRQDLIKLAKGS